MRWLEHRVPPPIVAACTAALMLGAAWVLPAFHIEVPWAAAIGAAFAAIGLAIAAAGVLEFLRARTTVNPLDPAAASALVVRGIYKRTRNPMYVGMAAVLLGWAVYLANAAALAVAAIFVAYINRFQIAPEERALEARFGAEYSRYCARVRRWL
jgi:protein-S-isoprenylcysteine O-methyltransferase Ste14